MMGKRVAILGGGVAGLSAAHELAERGFDVVVYDEHHVPGGKARSFPTMGTATKGRLDLPGEHGFRFFPGFYKHLPDTMKRIPFANQPNGVFDNLVEAPRMMMARQGAAPLIMPARFPQSLPDVTAGLLGFMQANHLGIPLREQLHFADRMLTFAASCDERRLNEYEHESWWDFIGAATRSAAYQRFLAIGLSRSLVACRAEEISARTGATILLQLLINMATPGAQVDRLLCGPTNEVWIRPWLEYLGRRGVRYLHPVQVQHIDCRRDRITGVTVCHTATGAIETISADYYIAAVPIEVMRRLATDAMRAADPRLGRLHGLRIAWMNGVQFYLRHDVPVVQGHTIYIDSPWSLTSISQQQFWRDRIAQDYGNGSVGGILSVDVSNWDARGMLFGKTARQCTRDQIKQEVWAQLKAHLNVGGATVLADTNLVSWNLDRDIREHACKSGRHTVDCIDREPLLINTKGSWHSRPEAVTRIANFFLASDYVQTHTDLATMEGANEAARSAVNGLLAASGSNAQKCELWPLSEPAVFAPLREADRFIYAAQTGHPLDAPLTAVLKDGATQLLERAAHVPGAGLFSPLFDALRGAQAARSAAVEGAPPPRHARPAPTPEGKIKVAVLGGGMGSLAAAFELTNSPESRDRYDVTIYQQGWRLGGKGASGRNPAHHDRIEEHGPHVWFGFYDNAFRVMRQCYEELGRPPAAPLATLDDAFKPCSDLVLYEQHDGRWIGWPFKLPENPLTPGEPSDLPAFWDVAHAALHWLWGYWKSLRPKWKAAVRDVETGGGLADWVHELSSEIEAVVETAEVAGAVAMFELALTLADVRRNNPVGALSAGRHQTLLGKLLDEFRTWLWDTVIEKNLDDDDLRLFFTTFDIAVSVLRGVIVDGLVERGFNSANNEEMTAWLKRHGAQAITLNDSPILRCMYDVPFAYRDGDPTQRDFAAGVGLSVMMRLLFSYKGAFSYKMQAGMGDTVFAPFYEVLERRGVHFKFFHHVSKLHLAADKQSIDSIEVVPQVHVLADEYKPLVSVKGLPCWPSEPLWDKLADGEQLQRDGVNFEVDANPLRRKPLTLRKGDHFHVVVLGISVAALPPICEELIRDRANPAFAAMIENARTTMTQSFQIWLNRPLHQLGWAFEADSIMTAYVEPMDTFCGMNHLIERESWPRQANVRSLVYLCGVLSDQPGDTQARATARVKSTAVQWLQEATAPVLPHAMRSKPGSRTTAFDWDLLVAGDRSAGREEPSEQRFDTQFWRANFQPTERYVLSAAGSIKYRLKTDESGYNNLFLTGDWINNIGLNGGCIEAATMSGLQAARAVIGAGVPIVGEDDTWLRGHRVHAAEAPLQTQPVGRRRATSSTRKRARPKRRSA